MRTLPERSPSVVSVTVVHSACRQELQTTDCWSLAAAPSETRIPDRGRPPEHLSGRLPPSCEEDAKSKLVRFVYCGDLQKRPPVGPHTLSAVGTLCESLRVVLYHDKGSSLSVIGQTG